ncbi:RmlC-like cupin domain-containing protein [Peziza echinospora]|nr:RmlC-like cupin domain-containing protein [Peziza echinospora]
MPNPENPTAATSDFPFTAVRAASEEPLGSQSLIGSLNLTPHPEGGYYTRTHCDKATLPNGRPLSSSIYYLLTPASPVGRFHKHGSLTVHCLHSGRGRYVLVSEEDGSIETFAVRGNVEKGQKLQWVVPGGVWKASWAEPDEEGDGESGGGGLRQLLISEVVIPAFSFDDHAFMTRAKLESLVGAELARKMDWLVRPEEEEQK